MLATILAYITVCMTIIGFVATVADRVLAKLSKTRIPENLLFLMACLLGALGVTLGFFLAKRGLYKQETRLGVPAIALGEIVLLVWMVPGFWDAVLAVFRGA